MLALLLALSNAAAPGARQGFTAGERFPSASTLVKTYFHEEDWPFERALDAMGTVPREVLGLLRQARPRSKFLQSRVALVQGGRSDDWTEEELATGRGILNKMYSTQQDELDVLLFDCKMFLDTVQGQLEENQRVQTHLSELTAESRAEQLTATATKKQAEEQLESLREQHDANQVLCTQTMTARKAELFYAEADYTVGLTLQNMTTCSEEQVRAAIAAETGALDASMLAKSHTISACSTGAGEELRLGGAAPAFHTPAARAALERAARLALEEGRVQRVLMQTTAMTAMEEDPASEGYKCNVHAVPNCPLLADAVQTMVGELQETMVDSKTTYEALLGRCNAVAADFLAQIKDAEVAHDAAEVTLAKVISRIDTATGEGGNKAREYAELEQEHTAKDDECGAKKNAILETMCGIKVVRLELYTMAARPATIFADCEVADWVPQECPVACGGGTQALSREVLEPASGGSACPPLRMEQACNEAPCPVDCAVGDWSGWSECSKDCGGGVRARSRNTETEEEHGGEVCPPTSDTELCNPGACDVACVIGDWSEWSDCSKMCSSGISVRRRGEETPASGAGTCEDPDSAHRFQQRPCNEETCDDNVVCSAKLDIVIVMDGSGSVSVGGFEKEKTFVRALVNQFELGESAAKVGVVMFANSVFIRDQMDFDASRLTADIEGTEWPAAMFGNGRKPEWGTNTPEALGLALDVLAAGGRTSAQSIVFVVTDGKPTVTGTAEMAAKVRDKARLVWVGVGKKVPVENLRTWASFPPDQNVLTTKGFSSLTKQVGAFLADICPSLECRETLSGNGADYIGCQSVTVSGRQCQMWDAMSPWKHKFRKKARKGQDGLGRNNFCRNPDGSESIWCYTTDDSVQREPCAPRNTTAYAPR